MNHTSSSKSPGFVTSAVVRQENAVFTLTLTDEAVSELSAVATYHDGQQDRTPLARPEVGSEWISTLALNDGGPPLRSLELQAKVNGEFQPLELRDGACHLHRLLSLDLEQINDNLRWRNRINDLETRFFSAKNSLRLVGDDFELRARCIVSVGWEGLEQEHNEIIDWCRSQYQLMLSWNLGPEEHEALMSTITFWCHLAIHDGRREMLRELSEKTISALYAPEARGIAVYNMLHTSLLIGGWHLSQGRHKIALRFFKRSNGLLKLAVHEYPTALVNYRELATIAEKVFFCQIGRHMAEGKKILESFPLLSPEIAWREGNRLRNKIAQKRMLEKYLALCSKPTEPTISPA